MPYFFEYLGNKVAVNVAGKTWLPNQVQEVEDQYVAMLRQWPDTWAEQGGGRVSYPTQIPTGFVAVAGDTTLFLRWNPVDLSLLSKYRVTLSPGNLVFETTNTSLIVTGLQNGATYTASLQSVNMAQNVSAAVSASGTPAAGPSGLSSIAGLVSWLAADRLAGPPSNGASVATWTDSSPNANSAITPVPLRPSGSFAPTAPTFLTTWTNGKAAIAFSGSGQGLGLNFDFTTAKYGSEATIFWAGECTSSTNAGAQRNQAIITNCGFVANPTYDDSRGFLLDTFGPGSPANYWRALVGYNTVNGAFALNTPTILSAVVPSFGSLGALYVNGAVVAGAQIPPIPINRNRWAIGTSPNGSTNFTGRMGEILFFARALSQSERWAVEAYLAAKYAITVSQS